MAVKFKNENCFNFLSHLMISLIFYRRSPLKPVTMATRNALFPIFELQKSPNTYLGKVTKFQFNSFSRLGAAFIKREGGGGGHPSPPVRLGLRKKRRSRGRGGQRKISIQMESRLTQFE